MTQPPPRLAKLVLIGLLGLALLVPLILVGGVIQDRENWQEEARRQVAAAWGEPQTLLGPLFVLPYRLRGETERRMLVLAPEHLSTRVTLAPERRRRGLFETVVYTASIAWEAGFLPAAMLPEGAEPIWAEAHLLTGASDIRQVEPARVQWAGRALEAAPGLVNCGLFETQRWPLALSAPPSGSAALPPGPAAYPPGGFPTPPGSSASPGLGASHQPIAAPPQVLAMPSRSGLPVTASGAMSLRGTGSLRALPLGPRARLSIAAPWATPSYIGTDLPSRVTHSDDGFQAEWQGGQEAEVGLSPHGCLQGIGTRHGVGVALIEPVQTYRMVTRAAKYAVMFVALAFLTYLLFELVAGVRIHIVQYALLGASLVLFPLLLLAIAEPLGFAAAYATAAAMVMGQAGLYTAAVVGRRLLAAIFAAVLAGLFGFLYVVLSLESFSLLVGAVALFAALSAVMLVTRRVQWG